MKRIGILSDTHGKLRAEISEILRDCDVILHAGDINTMQVLETLRETAPLYVVRSNADKEWAADLPTVSDPSGNQSGGCAGEDGAAAEPIKEAGSRRQRGLNGLYTFFRM